MTRAEVRKALDSEPWLVLTLREDDEDIQAARDRFNRMQRLALERLNLEEDFELEVRFRKSSGLLTTSLAHAPNMAVEP